MSKKTVEVFQSKITRNDRFAQMSHQEQVIEQKKKEIQARLEQKQKGQVVTTTTEAKTSTTTTCSTAKPTKSIAKIQDKKSAFNTFSNDGSFLDQFKQMKDKKMEQKLKSFKSRDSDKTHSDERSKTSRWSQPAKESRVTKPRVSRFSDKPVAFEPKINITTTYSNLLSQPNFEQISPHTVMGQPLLKNHPVPLSVPYPQPLTSESVIVAPPVLLNMPPPQIIQSTMASIVGSTTTILTTDVGNLITPTTVLTSVTLAPPLPCQERSETTTNVITVQPNIELSSIPPPSPIQIHTISDSINTLTIPTVQLNEIPKALDILNIPTPNDCLEQNIADAEFIKNIPPPNKSIPPPTLPETTINMTIPPPTASEVIPTCLPPPNILVQTIPPPQITQITVQNLAPPPPPPPLMQTLTLQGQVPVGVPPPPNVSNNIPSLMAQPVLPPPGMGIAPPMNMNCPPPMLQTSVSCSIIQPPPPVYVTQPPPPLIGQMPPMNIPPPIAMGQQAQMIGSYHDMNTVFPPGTADYEAMASLGRMVAQCGSGIEDVVCQRKTQDPSLWFLFYKESAAYRQYQQLVDQFIAEIADSKREDNFYNPEDTYEQDSVDDEYIEKRGRANSEGEKIGKRKRKSRWGDKANVVSPPAVVPLQANILSPGTGGVLISRITRTDPGLIQYAINTFGSSNLTEEDWKKAEDHYKINILYQEMVRKRQEVERLRIAGRNKYEYDSDEETDGGTWEHKLREKEMFATQQWANELTRQSEGKHHIGDFLPPEELKKFMEKSTAIKDGRQPSLSDYKEFKLKEDNIGFKMLQKLGWSEGQGLGSNSTGIVEPVNKGTIRDQNQGLGLDQPDLMDDNDDEYESYRKRMMLAYRFRPNPLNNPRRPYY